MKRKNKLSTKEYFFLEFTVYLIIRTLFLENDTKSLHCWKGLTSFWTLSKSINYVNEHY